MRIFPLDSIAAVALKSVFDSSEKDEVKTLIAFSN